ncbi:MAG TPA: OmpH family outer membrane protein [Sphingomicrobium sp.]|jgi:Skp family chaperone for outer membrane proteins
MKTIISSALIAAAAIALPGQALAQNASVIVVDTDTILRTCTACQSAAGQLQTRQTALQTRAQTLKTTLETEGAPIQKAFEALAGKQPDAALRQRITAYQTKERTAQQEMETAQATLQSTAANVQQQIGSRLIQVVEQVRARRNAAIAISKGSTLANSTGIDVTTEVLTALNTALPAVSVTPLPQQQAAPAAAGR